MSELLVNDRKLSLLNDLELSGSLTVVGFTMPMEVTVVQYEAIGRMFGTAHESLKFAIGDWFLQGEAIFGDDVHQYAEAIGISKPSLQQYVRVAEKIPLARRRENLTWSHHRAVVSLEPEEQDVWLDRSAASGWSKTDLENHLREQREEPVVKPKPEYVRPGGAVEAALMAAADVWGTAKQHDDDWYLVPAAAMRKLADLIEIDG